MSVKQAENPPAARKPGRFARMAGRLRGLHLPARAAIATAILLLLLFVAVVAIYLLNPNHVPWRHSLTAGRIVAVILLAIAIPFVVYNGLRLWLEGERSRFPEIDYAWRAGLEALDRNGLSIDDAPLFLVLGSAGESFDRSLLDAAGMNFRVRGAPQGPAPLHWYADPERIILVCSDVGCLSALSGLVARQQKTNLAWQWSGEGPSAPSAGAPPAENAASQERVLPADSSPPGQFAHTGSAGTVEIDQVPAPTAAASPGERVPQAGSAGTVEIDQIPAGGAPPSGPATTRQSSETLAQHRLPAADEEPATLSTGQSSEQIQRLEYVCRLVRRARRPLCGINGLLTLLPFESLSGRQREHEELQKALAADVSSVHEELRLRCAVTTLIVGMEQERGFRELVRRVGRQRAAMQRFGKGFDLRALPSRDELAALCAHVCGAFEDWSYMLFREQGVLSHPGNRHLYSLLCKIRGNVKERLTAALAGGYGYDPGSSSAEPILYSGCYFGATGQSDDRQAFVRGVFDKLDSEQEEVEWTPQALDSERRDRVLAMLGFALCALLAMTLGAMIVNTLSG